MKFVVGLLLGLIVGAAGMHFYMGGAKPKVNVNVHTQDVQNELAHAGVVIKEKAREAGAAIADATADTRATTAIKSKLATELGASTLGNISVSTSDGVVTLSGTVNSNDEITKAVNVAYAAENVRKVYSTLQVKGSK